MQEIFGTQSLITNSGDLKISDLSRNKIVGLYFTAHWCPPCRTFTPKLISLYKTANSQTKTFEIVFISFDRDSETMNNYFEEMPWAAVPYSETTLREDLGDKFGVTGIPALVVLNSNGEVISSDGRSDVYSKNAEVVDFWVKKAENPNMSETPRRPEDADAEVEESNFSRDPVEGLVCDKNHPLIWHGDVGKYYKENLGNGTIACNYCRVQLRRSSWHCRECRFDLCKDCHDWVVESKKSQSPYLKCWENHSLYFSDKIKEFYQKKFGADKYFCRACNTQQNGSNFHCRRCFFDICGSCQNSIDTNAPLASKVLCEKGHSISWAPDTCKKYKEKYNSTRYGCNICSRSYTGAGSFQCLPCTYDLCVLCIGHAVQTAGK